MSNTAIVQEKPKYPKRIVGILLIGTFERISDIGLRTALFSYLENVIKYDEDNIALVYRAFRGLCYTFPVFGALFGDCWLGKYKTILYFSLIYISGIILLSLSVVVYADSVSLTLLFSGLILIAAGAGTTKPCIPAFAGDQFVLPEQQKSMENYFYFYHVFLNVGGAIGAAMAPEVSKINCFYFKRCIILDFVVGTTSMILGYASFLFGTHFYVCQSPKENDTIYWIQCVLNGVKHKIVSKEKADHWLDYSEEEYGKLFVKQTKASLRLIIVFIPFVFFGSTLVLQVTEWTTQAELMYTELGDLVIDPPNMLITNYLLVIILTPILCFMLFPLCEKCFIITPLRRMVCGQVCIAISLFTAAFISMAIETEVPDLPSSGEAHIRFYNPLDCTTKINVPPYIDLEIEPMGYQFLKIKVEGNHLMGYKISGCDEINATKTTGQSFPIKEKTSLGYFLTINGMMSFEENFEKLDDADPQMRILVGNPNESDSKLKYICPYGDVTEISTDDFSTRAVTVGYFKIGDREKAARFSRGGIYRVLIYFENNTMKEIKVHQVGEANKVHVFWQIPQYVLFTVGEILIIPTLFEFVYTQAPASLKCTMTAIWLTVSGTGNTIVIIITLIHFFRKQSNLYFTYGVLMMICSIVGGFLAVKYKYVDRYYGQEDDIIDAENKEIQNYVVYF